MNAAITPASLTTCKRVEFESVQQDTKDNFRDVRLSPIYRTVRVRTCMSVPCKRALRYGFESKEHRPGK